MKYILLVVKMSRYKSALILIIFLLLSFMLHGYVFTTINILELIAAGASLLLTYMMAACINDLADWEIDQINLKGHGDRPLVNGGYTRRDVLLLAIVAAIGALLFAICCNAFTAAIILIALLLNVIYSLPPARISYRAVLTPFYLAVCYVLVPFAVAWSLGDRSQFAWGYAGACYLLFLARISLKDFRDRKGDKAVGKPTIILKYGKTVTCALSVYSALIGLIWLMILMRSQVLFEIALLLFTAAIGFIQLRLYRARTLDQELLSIGYGARMGNGVLLLLLGNLLLVSEGASTFVIGLFYVTIILVYGMLFWQYAKRPDSFYFGTRKLKV
jgi:4-hydroxybenzoate polyprenyltransferase